MHAREQGLGSLAASVVGLALGLFLALLLAAGCDRSGEARRPELPVSRLIEIAVNDARGRGLEVTGAVDRGTFVWRDHAGVRRRCRNIEVCARPQGGVALKAVVTLDSETGEVLTVAGPD